MPEVKKQQGGAPKAMKPAWKKPKKTGTGPVSKTKVKPKAAASDDGGTAGDVWDRVRPISRSKFIKILLYGRSGSGKTTLWATFPGKILAILCSGSKKKSDETLSLGPEYDNKVEEVTLNHSRELFELVDCLQEGRRSRSGEPFKTVVLDNASGLEARILAEVLGMDDLPQQLHWGLAQQDEYGETQSQWKEAIIRLVSLEMNVVIIAHERIHNPPAETGSDLITPTVGAAVMPKAHDWLNGVVSHIGQCYQAKKKVLKKIKVKKGKEVTYREEEVELDEQQWYLRVKDTEFVHVTKFRKPKDGKPLPKAIPDPSYDKIMALITGR